MRLRQIFNKNRSSLFCLLRIGAVSLALLILESQALAVSRWGCAGAAVGEFLLPGSGYAFTRQWDKTVVFGGSRWIVANHYYTASESEHYQETDDVYSKVGANDSESGKTEITVTLNKETWAADYYGTLYTNLLFISWADLYQNDCEENTRTYELMLSPFRVDKFYDKWTFWLPVAALVVNYATFTNYTKAEYILQRGLKESDLKRDAFSQYYMVGIGEEMFFRGTLQHQLYYLSRDSWGFSPNVSRHIAVFGASALFAVAHNGEGLTALPQGAFLFGLYEGYVYQPSLTEFDLETAIAIHAWWDIMISYAFLNHAKITETQRSVRIPILRIGFNF